MRMTLTWMTKPSATELTYFNYLRANLTFPFPAQFFDPISDRKRDVTVTGMCDDFPIDDGFGVMCEVLDGGEKGQMPLSELEMEQSDPSYQMVDDYITWFANAPEADVDENLDEDWEATIQTIANECNRDLNGANNILMAWRVKLEKEPNLLQPFQIDEIVREVRQRLIHVSRRYRLAKLLKLPAAQKITGFHNAP